MSYVSSSTPCRNLLFCDNLDVLCTSRIEQCVQAYTALVSIRVMPCLLRGQTKRSSLNGRINSLSSLSVKLLGYLGYFNGPGKTRDFVVQSTFH